MHTSKASVWQTILVRAEVNKALGSDSDGRGGKPCKPGGFPGRPRFGSRRRMWHVGSPAWFVIVWAKRPRRRSEAQRAYPLRSVYTQSTEQFSHVFIFHLYIYIYMDKLTCINADTRSAEVFIVMGKTSTVYILICFSTHPDVHYELRNHIICLCF